MLWSSVLSASSSTSKPITSYGTSFPSNIIQIVSPTETWIWISPFLIPALNSSSVNVFLYLCVMFSSFPVSFDFSCSWSESTPGMAQLQNGCNGSAHTASANFCAVSFTLPAANSRNASLSLLINFLLPTASIRNPYALNLIELILILFVLLLFDMFCFSCKAISAEPVYAFLHPLKSRESVTLRSYLIVHHSAVWRTHL